MEILKTRSGKIAKSKIVAGYSNLYYLITTKRINKEIRTEWREIALYRFSEWIDILITAGKFNYILHEETRLTNNKLTKLHYEAIKTGLTAF
jgi:hypothetical protein